MKQYDVYRNPDPASAKRRPYLAVLQSDFLTVIDTVVVAPLAASTRVKPVARMMPVVAVADVEHYLMTQELAAISRSVLKKPVGSIAAWRSEIVAALDLIFLGF